MKKLWFFLIASGIVFSVAGGHPGIVADVLLYDLNKALELVLGLVCIMGFWTGLMRIVEKSGILNRLTKAMRPAIKFLFGDARDNAASVNAAVMCIAANMFGIGNSATALGIRAMEEMQKTNRNKQRATNSMCMLLIINMSSIQLLPLSVIKLRADAGALSPTDIILPTIVATAFSTLIAVVAAKYYERKDAL